MYKSGLADLVDVTGQVDHLVGEAPLVVAHASSQGTRHILLPSALSQAFGLINVPNPNQGLTQNIISLSYQLWQLFSYQIIHKCCEKFKPE